MQSTRSSSKSGLFLIELIIAIVVFALASGICVQLFAKAHTISQKSSDLSGAVIAAQNAAEQFYLSDASPETLKQLLQPNEENESGDVVYLLYYTADWQPAAIREESHYVLEISLLPDGSLTNAQIVVSKSATNEEIYALTARRFSAQKG